MACREKPVASGLPGSKIQRSKCNIQAGSTLTLPESFREKCILAARLEFDPQPFPHGLTVLDGDRL
jgi:hypothetical protein